MEKGNQLNREDSLSVGYSVIIEDGKQFLCYKGEILPNQEETIVKQDASDAHDEPPICHITMTVVAVLRDSIA